MTGYPSGAEVRVHPGGEGRPHAIEARGLAEFEKECLAEALFLGHLAE